MWTASKLTWSGKTRQSSGASERSIFHFAISLPLKFFKNHHKEKSMSQSCYMNKYFQQCSLARFSDWGLF